LNLRFVNLSAQELYQIIKQSSNIVAADLRGCMVDDTVINYLFSLNKLQVLFLQSGRNITAGAMVSFLLHCKELKWIRIQGKMLFRDKMIRYLTTHKNENYLAIINPNGQFLYDSILPQRKNKSVKRRLNRVLHKMNEGTGKGKKRKRK